MPAHIVRSGGRSRHCEGYLGERGQSLAEAAVLLSGLLLLMLALVQFAIVVHVRDVVQEACAEGVTTAAAADGTVPAGVASAQALLRDGIGQSATGIAVTGGSNGATVTFQTSGRLPLLLPGLDVSLPVTAQCEMLKERLNGG